ncbi:MAG: SpoIVB peptidase [Bacillota bacterium]|nr:SpoIVB peptidase [Bacillota bacterium]
MSYRKIASLIKGGVTNSRGARVFLAICLLFGYFGMRYYPALSADSYRLIADGQPAHAAYQPAFSATPLPQALPAGSMDGTAAGQYQLQLAMDGGPTVKTVAVESVTMPQVVSGGHSIGILLQTEGVLIVGFSPLSAADGSLLDLAAEAGLELGDFILDIDGVPLRSNQQLTELVAAAGNEERSCKISYLRNGLRRSCEIMPRYCADSRSYRIGLYVRDNTAGIGTLSFFEPQTLRYAALGHAVADLSAPDGDTQRGSIVRAAVSGIRSGSDGIPGEKLGVFIDGDWRGSIIRNSELGIFGTLQVGGEAPPQGLLLPLAVPSQVTTGAATILTVLDGEKIESFDISIVKTMENYKLTGKGMIIEITDPQLLTRSGGIVQGMSGSPIIQNGLLAGVVTHVFINDPTHGYACFAAWMAEEMGTLEL